MGKNNYFGEISLDVKLSRNCRSCFFFFFESKKYNFSMKLLEKKTQLGLEMTFLLAEIIISVKFQIKFNQINMKNKKQW